MTKVTILFALISTLVAFSQEEVNYSNLRSLRDGEVFIRFQVMDLSDSKKVKLEKEETYFWFKSQKVMTTQGGASGLLLDGIYEEFYPNNQLKVKGYFKKGVKHNAWKFWDESGNLVKIVEWRKGRRIKDAEEYNSSGELIKKKDFSANQTTYYLDNKIINAWDDSTEVEVIHKYENGQTKRIDRFKNGHRDGKQIEYSPEGELISLSNYKNGKLHGKQIDKEGNKSFYKNGEPHTPFLKRLFNKKPDSEKDNPEEKKKTPKQEETEKQQKDEK